MLRNYKLTVAYDGSRFYGWASQPDQEMTIQGKLESVLSRMVEEDVEVIGAGRTDAGVHARGMVANVHLDTTMTERQIRDYCNQYLPDDICVREVKAASDRFHARYNAIGKTYCYTIYVGDLKPLFQRKYVFEVFDKPDVARMQEASKYLLGTHDFAGFSHNPRMKKSTVRTVDSIVIEKKGDFITFTYHGDGFLQYMVRILTGTLIEVGQGKREPENMKELLEKKDRSLAGFTAPAKGLTLLKVDYQ
ncbi:MAG: tRNA pseudouridine(38-40) synthase TruA [Lachnospiraceae bacterium]|nr:tRNA pseudouridine(38-40) synthase TruA [Lachnospiraceae bacterium]